MQSTDETTGVSYFEYEITLPDNTVVADSTTSSLITAPVTTPMDEDETYQVRIRAVDGFGHASSWASSTFTATSDVSPICDLTAPVGGVQQEIVSNGINAEVTCSDTQSGCSNSYEYALIDPTSVCTDATYTTEQYSNGPILVDETLRMCWRVFDQATPANSDEGSTVISAGVYIELHEPTFGISSEKEFTLHATTQRSAECRQNEYLISHSAMNDEQRHNDLVGRGVTTDFETSDGVNHIINNFNTLSRTDEEYSGDWLFTCYSEGIYSSRIISIGYDTTAPVIDITADPNPLNEPIHTSSQLSIDLRSDDEDSLCTYLQPTISPYSPPPGVYHFYTPTSNPNNRQHYDQLYETRIPENSLWSFSTAAYTTYSYIATCTNLAGVSSNAGVDVVIDPPNDLSVTILTPSQVNTQNVLINATTVIASTCVYSVDSLEPQVMSTSDDLYHYATRSLPEGERGIVVNCVSIYSQQLTGSDQKDVYVDSQNPSVPEITATSPTCSLDDPISVRIQSEDAGSGIDYYEYELEENNVLLGTYSSSAELFDLPLQTPLQNSYVYEIRGRAIDHAGNIGSWSSWLFR